MTEFKAGDWVARNHSAFSDRRDYKVGTNPFKIFRMSQEGYWAIDEFGETHDTDQLTHWLTDQDRSATTTKSYDAINPSHYKTASGLEVIDVIEAFDLGRNVSHAVKYQLRAGKKPGNEEAQELRKAIWWLQRRVDNLEAGAK